MKKFFAIAAVVVSLLGLSATSEAHCHGGYGQGGYHCYDSYAR